MLQFGLGQRKGFDKSKDEAGRDNVVLARVTGATLLGYYVLAFNISGWPMSLLDSTPFFGRNFCVRPPKVSAA